MIRSAEHATQHGETIRCDRFHGHIRMRAELREGWLVPDCDKGVMMSPDEADTLAATLTAMATKMRSEVPRG